MTRSRTLKFSDSFCRILMTRMSVATLSSMVLYLCLFQARTDSTHTPENVDEESNDFRLAAELIVVGRPGGNRPRTFPKEGTDVFARNRPEMQVSRLVPPESIALAQHTGRRATEFNGLQGGRRAVGRVPRTGWFCG